VQEKETTARVSAIKKIPAALVSLLLEPARLDNEVKRMLAQLIQTAKECGVKVGICGQGPSDHPEFAQFLVEQGIDSISVTPNSVIKTIKAIYAIEQETPKEVKQLQTQ